MRADKIPAEVTVCTVSGQIRDNRGDERAFILGSGVYEHGGRLQPVPNKPKTPVTGFRIPPALKAEASKCAAKEGKTLTDVVVESLDHYVKTRRES